MSIGLIVGASVVGGAVSIAQILDVPSHVMSKKMIVTQTITLMAIKMVAH